MDNDYLSKIENLQGVIANYDFSMLTVPSQIQALNMLRQITNLVVTSFITDSTTTIDQISSVLTNISSTQKINRPPTSIHFDASTPTISTE